MAAQLHDVANGFTLKHRWLTSAVLHGKKPLENRSQCWPPGWYALHSGLAGEAPGDEMEMHVRSSCDSDEDVSTIAEDVRAGRVPKGHIVGLCRIAHALPVEADCLQGCKWSRGPVCLVISETLWLHTPIPASGQQGTWKLSSMTRCEIAQQVAQCALGVHGHELTYPPDPAALQRMQERNRAAKRAQRAEAEEAQREPKFARA